MNPHEILEEVGRLGGEIYREGSTLRLRPAEIFDVGLVHKIVSQKPEILKILEAGCAPAPRGDEEVAWRVGAMLKSLTPGGPIPVLAAREGGWLADPQRCNSCGDEVGKSSEPSGAGYRHICHFLFNV